MSVLPTLQWESAFGAAPRHIVRYHRLEGEHYAHDHDFMELVLILDGSGRHESALGAFSLERGVALLLRPGVWHSYSACKGLELINVCFPQSLVRTEWRLILGERVRSLLRSGEGLTYVRLPGSTATAFQQIEGIGRGESGSLGLMLWVLDQFATASPSHPDVVHPAVEAALTALEESPSKNWQVQDLAVEVGLDRAYLSRLFKQFVGVGPMAYLAMLRAERAAALLRSSSLNCGEIAIEVGYSDPNLFSRRFRARFGKSPREYRDAARKTGS